MLMTSRHHQGVTAEVFRIRSDLGNRPGAENDWFGSGKFKLHKIVGRNTTLWFPDSVGGFYPHSSGKTWLNFTLCLGSAIIGATASRQTA